MISLRFPTLIAERLSATELLMESQKLARTFDLNNVLKRARLIYLQLTGLPEVLFIFGFNLSQRVFTTPPCRLQSLGLNL